MTTYINSGLTKVVRILSHRIHR